MPAIHFLIKPASSDCNLRCSYCFYRAEASGRKAASFGIMSEETLERIVQKGLEYADGVCGFIFQGGEPTLAGLPFFRKAVELEKRYNSKHVRIQNSLQTNGMLMDEAWARFLHDNHFLVGLSLDGPKDIHNLNRVDARKNGTFNAVMKAAGLLDRYGVEYNILAVVTACSSRFADRIYNFFRKNGFSYLQFIPCLEPVGMGHGNCAFSLRPADLARFLMRLFDRWYSDFMRGDYVSIRYFDNLVRMLNGQSPEACDMAGRCSCNCVIESDGSVYPCDFYALDEWKLGNIREDSVNELLTCDKARAFVETSEKLDNACRHCRWYPLCRGGCRRECEPLPEDGIRKNYFCKAYRRFLEHSYDRLAEIAGLLSRRI